MKTYIADIIPKIQRYSQKLDNLTLLTEQHWVVIDNEMSNKNVYIFRTNGILLISQNGRVEKAKWEYLGSNTILIDRKDESFLYRHGFFDENVLALKIDGLDEYAFLINESRYDGDLNSSQKVISFLQKMYCIDKANDELLNNFDIKNNEFIDKQIINKIPDYQKILISKNKTIFMGSIEKYKITFNDQYQDFIYIILNSNTAFFRERHSYKYTTVTHEYDTVEHCISALYYFHITNKIQKTYGYIRSYS